MLVYGLGGKMFGNEYAERSRPNVPGIAKPSKPDTAPRRIEREVLEGFSDPKPKPISQDRPEN